jgi:hypothetical protein
MSEQQEFNDNMSDFTEDHRRIERLLASLVPRETRVNRDRLMFQAGQASAGSQKTRFRGATRWIWPAATACSACLGLLVGIFFGHAPATPTDPVVEVLRGEHNTVVEQLSSVRRSSSTTEDDQTFSLVTLQNRLLTAARDDPSRLADSLETVATASHPSPASTYSELLRQLLAERT